jgi:hypothetical protein
MGRIAQLVGEKNYLLPCFDNMEDTQAALKNFLQPPLMIYILHANENGLESAPALVRSYHAPSRYSLS